MKLDFKDRTAQLIAIIVVMALALGIAAYFVFHKDKQISEMQEQYTIDKQELEDEYESISMQYEGFKFSVQNDSLSSRAFVFAPNNALIIPLFLFHPASLLSPYFILTSVSQYRHTNYTPSFSRVLHEIYLHPRND